MYDLLVTNCRVVDGCGSPEFHADIAVKDGLFARIAPSIRESSARTIDAGGAYACPGFIDIHRHGDAFVFRPEYGETEARQGITTTINGNCGLSIVPLAPGTRAESLAFLRPITGALPHGFDFETFSEYLRLVSRQRLAVNFGMHVGNGTLRTAVKGFAEGELSTKELARLHGYLRDAMDAGAFGISVGMVYSPENFYDADGVVAALKPAAGSGIPLVAHIRGEGELLVESVKEVILIAKRLEIPLHLSHFKCVGRDNWGHKLRQAIDLVEAAQAEGMRITCDVYPWTAGSSQLAQLLPPEFLEGGLAMAAARLRDPKGMRRCREILSKRQTHFENQALTVGLENIMISAVKTDANKHLIGKTITEAAALRKQDPLEAVLTILAEEDCEGAMINFIVCDEDLRTVMKLPYCSIISDSIYSDGGLPHPRLYGSFPKLFAEFVRDEHVLTLPEAVRKCTSGPADRFGIAGRGAIREGYHADLAVFNLDEIANHATYLDPRQLATGMKLVLVNGEAVNESDSFVNRGSGKVIGRERW